MNNLLAIATVIIIVLLVFLAVIWRIQRSSTYKAVGAELDFMDEVFFERYLAMLFCRMGYQVRRVNYADNVSTLVATSNGVSYVIQARRNRRKVNIKAIEDAIATRKHLKCERAIVVTNHFFSNGARQVAKANQVITMDRHDLIQELTQSTGNKADHNSPISRDNSIDSLGTVRREK
jgi:restriction system protein